MGRKVNARPVGVVYPFVPRSLGNAEDSSPVTFHIKAISEKEKRRLVDHRDYNKPVSSMSEVVKDLIVKIDNYEDANGEPIVDGNDLFKSGESEFIAEAIEEIMLGTVYDEDSKKN